MKEKNQYDVIIIGGGPAGTTCASILSREGHEVLLLEKHKFPRFHIGESITAFGANAFKKLGIYEELKQIGYVKKKGAEFIFQEKSYSAYFNKSFQNESDELPWAFQMARSKLDLLLLENARKSGATILEQHVVKRVLFNGERAIGVEYKDLSKDAINPPLQYAYAKWIVDASGQAGLINKQVKNNCYNDFLLDKKLAIFNHWEGDFEITNTDEDVNFKFCIHENRRDWAWYIPIDKNIVSIGVVLSEESIRNRSESLEGVFYKYAEQLPFISDFLKNPTLKPIDKFRSARDYSYRCKQYYGDGWVLVGDSAGFIDPIFSTGLQIAFSSAFMLVDALHEVLNQKSPNYSKLKAYNKDVDKLYKINSMFVYLYYLSGLEFDKLWSISHMWKCLEWSGLKYPVLFLWYALQIRLASKKQAGIWGDEILFGIIKSQNPLANLLLALSENYERLQNRRSKNVISRNQFLEMEV